MFGKPFLREMKDINKWLYPLRLILITEGSSGREE